MGSIDRETMEPIGGPDLGAVSGWGDVSKALDRFREREKWATFEGHERVTNPNGMCLRAILEQAGGDTEGALLILGSMYRGYIERGELASMFGEGSEREYCLWAAQGRLLPEQIERALARVDLIMRWPDVEDRFKAATDRDKRLDGLELAAHRRADRGLRFGIDKLDALLHGGAGILPGEMLNIVGAEGGGKTSIALNAIVDYVAQGGACLFLSLDMAPARVDMMLMRRILNLTDEGVFRLMRTDPGAYQAARDKAYELYERIVVMGGPLTVEGIKAAALASEADVIALDFVTSPSLRGFDGNQYRQSMAVSDMAKEMAQRWGLTVILLSQVSRASGLDRARGGTGGHGAGGAILEQTVDFELELFSEPPASGDDAWRMFVTLRKNRSGPKMRSFEIFPLYPSMEFSRRADEAELPARKPLFSIKL